MRRALAASFLAILFSLPASASTLPELFLKAKQQFRLGAYSDTLATLERLEAASEELANQELRAALRPSLLFYRGACYAALGRAEEAHTDLQEFLTYKPGAALDPALYPPKVIAALRGARTDVAAPPKPERAGSLAAAYHVFPREISAPAAPLDETWSKGPVHYLMTAEERDTFDHLSNPISRSEFVTEFWGSRDPNPETPENEFREEFEKRVAFADSRFVQEETRGSMTDRGMVFVLLGPPTYAGRKPLRTGEDTADPTGMVMYTDAQVANALRGANTGASAAQTYDRMTSPTNRLPDSDGNYREVWHYRRELLPKGVSFQQVDFDFITRKGYGRSTLQRDAMTLATMEAARKELRTGRVVQSASR